MPDITPILKELYGEEIEITEDTIVLWVNAFIPRPTTGEKTVPAGPHQGEKMIPGPMPWSDGFLTDNRGFSNDPAASVRMQSLAIFDLRTAVPNWVSYHRCGETVELDWEDGDVEESARALTDGMAFSDFFGDSKLFTVNLDASASNPCHSGPSIDYQGQFTVMPQARLLIFDGKVDTYPSFEAYVQRGTGSTAKIFTESHASGASPWNLPLDASKRILVNVKF